MAAMPRIASQIIASRLRPMGSAEEEGMLKPLVVVVVGEAEVVVAIFFFFLFSRFCWVCGWEVLLVDFEERMLMEMETLAVCMYSLGAMLLVGRMFTMWM